MCLGHVEQILQVGEIPVHGINPFDHDELALVFAPSQGRLEGSGIVVFETVEPAAREDRAVAEAEMRPVVENRDVAFAQQPGESSERATEAAVEKHRVFPAEKLRHRPLEFPMEIGHAREHRRTARAHAVFREGLVGRGNHFRVIGQAEVIVGAKIDDRLRLAVVLNRSASVGRAEHVGLVKFRGPRYRVPAPFRKAGRWRKWIATLAYDEIAKATGCIKAGFRFWRVVVVAVSTHGSRSRLGEERG